MHLPFNQLSHWQKITFSAALIERMLPNYNMFSEIEATGDQKVLRNQLNLIWQWLDKKQRVKINYEAQFIKLEEQIPDPEEFNSFGVFPAVDACMALLSLLQLMQDKDSDGVNSVSRLSINSVTSYCELTNEETHNADIEEHPLMAWETATQQELFDYIIKQSETTEVAKEAKKLVLEEGMSNLGIEI